MREEREKPWNLAFVKKENERLRVDKKKERWLGKGDTNFNPLTNKSM